MKKNKTFKWEIKDVIAVALLSLFLILIQFIVNMVCMANHFVSMVLSIGFTMFLCAPVYYLLLCRVRKHFASLLYNGINLLPIWFFWETYYSFAKSSGMDQSYIDSYISYYKTPGWIIFIVIFTAICGLAGGLAGKKIMGKHFKKTGLL